MSIRFTESELNELRERVAKVEADGPGEIVVFVVRRSGSYEAVLWRGGAAGLIIAVVVLASLLTVLPAWGVGWLWSSTFAVSVLAIGAIAGTLLVRSYGPFFRTLAGKTLLSNTVKRRAQRAFLEEGVMETRGRTGVLMFVSVLERRIEVIVDKGISTVVSPSSWHDVIDAIREGLLRGDVVGALNDGISRCGDLLRASGIPAENPEKNELSDDIRFEAD